MRHRMLIVLLVVGPLVMLQAQTIEESLHRSLEGVRKPKGLEDFKPVFHFSPLNQDSTLVCWSFATTSFLESEMQRLGLEPVPLARMYPVYCIFLEKAKRFVATQGASVFQPGDLFSGVLDVVRRYGILPAEVYSGQAATCEVHSHSALYRELKDFMAGVKSQSAWDTSVVLDTVRVILNRHLGEPPGRFTFRGREYSPASFRDELVRLPWDEYLEVTSFGYAPYDTLVELEVPDNWAHRHQFLNVPLGQFYESLRGAVAQGYSVAIDADVSEPSYRLTKHYGYIPPFDLPQNEISPAARDFRFENRSTTDDHLMHIVGYSRIGGQDWFLVKDSWRTAFEGPLKGYMAFHESYIKLKVLAYLVHRSAVPSLVDRME